MARGIRTFANSEVRPYSRPAVIVLVRNWVDATEFGHGKLDPDHIVPRTLYMPDGRAVPVSVVAVEETVPSSAAPADVRWPATYIGGGCQLVANVQGAERTARVNCLVTDGHTTYALTNRHVCGEPGSPIEARLRGNVRHIGVASDRVGLDEAMHLSAVASMLRAHRSTKTVFNKAPRAAFTAIRMNLFGMR